MIIAKEKRQTNVAEYILYMWQVEDLLRACELDEGLIRERIVSRFDQPEEVREEIYRWYVDLSHMMREEQLVERGHLQIVKNTLADVVDCHNMLLKDPTASFYIASYYKTLPYLVDLRQRAGDAVKGEIETCFEALYGVLLLRMQGKEVGDDTLQAMRQISTLIAMLAEKYHHPTPPAE